MGRGESGFGENENGSNGESSNSDILPSGISRTEYVRIMLQALHDLGYSRSGQMLADESGIQAEATQIAELRTMIHDGNWDNVIKVIEKQGLTEVELQSALFSVRKQQYLELVEAGNVGSALKCLRGSIAKYAVTSSDLHDLSAILLYKVPRDLMAHLGLPDSCSSVTERRRVVVQEVQGCLPASSMLPERRLETLLCQAVEAQKQRSMYFNSLDRSIPLIEDYRSGPDQLPTCRLHAVQSHTDEAWFVTWSHDGSKVATTSRDCSVAIHNLEGKRLVQDCILRPRDAAISQCAWSASDRYIAAIGSSHEVALWDLAAPDRQRAKLMEYHGDTVTGIKWLRSSDEFVTCALDKRVLRWSDRCISDGLAPEEIWQSGCRLHDLAVTSDDSIAVATTEKEIVVLSLAGIIRHRIKHEDSITSIHVSMSGRFLLANIAAKPYAVVVYDAKDGFSVAQRVSGHKQGRFVIRSDIGGVNDNFIVAGSEDGHVHVWHRMTGKMLACVDGHAGSVNSVSWNPRRPDVLASVGDDCKLILWGSARALAQTLMGDV